MEKMKVIVCIVGIVVGIILSIVGIYFLNEDRDVVDIEEQSYFYPEYDDNDDVNDAILGIEYATAETSNHINHLLDYTMYGFKMIFDFLLIMILATGFGFVLVSTYKLSDIIGKKRQAKKALLAANNSFVPAPAAYQTPVNNIPVSRENTFFNQQ